jgi:hypothetical protein
MARKKSDRKRVWKRSRRETEEKRKRNGRETEEAWKRHGRDMEETWKRHGREMEEKWKRNGRGMEDMGEDLRPKHFVLKKQKKINGDVREKKKRRRETERGIRVDKPPCLSVLCLPCLSYLTSSTKERGKRRLTPMTLHCLSTYLTLPTCL